MNSPDYRSTLEGVGERVGRHLKEGLKRVERRIMIKGARSRKPSWTRKNIKGARNKRVAEEQKKT